MAADENERAEGLLAQVQRKKAERAGIVSPTGRGGGLLTQVQRAKVPPAGQGLPPRDWDDPSRIRYLGPKALREAIYGSEEPDVPVLVLRARRMGWCLMGTKASIISGGATLMDLAVAITGHENDYRLLDFHGDPRKVRSTDIVDITPLLRKAAGKGDKKGTENLPEIPPMSRNASMDERIEWLKRLAAHAQAAKRESGHRVFISVQLAQTILETGWGSSGLFREAWNIGGVKGRGNAGSIEMPTKEFIGGKQVTVPAGFAKYSSALEAFKAHGLLISRDRRYEMAMKAQTPEEQIREMHKAGYATDPNYVSKVMDIINRYKLQTYDH